MLTLNAGGHLARDASFKALPNGTEVLEFTVGVNVGYGQDKQTVWLKCSLFGRRGQALKDYLLKGTHVLVSGNMSLHKWQTKDGKDRQDIKLSVSEIDLIGRPDQQPQPQSPAQQQHQEDKQNGYQPQQGFDDDIPF